MRLSRRVSRGFTLVEILIVICVVGLLASLLFPAFSRSREAGRKTTCASNLRQIGLAFSLYVADNAGRYPSFNKYGNGGRCVWADRLSPSYIKSPGVFYCPSHPAENQLLSQCGGTEEIEIFKYGGSYDIVGYSTPTLLLSETRLRHPDSTILALDGLGTGVNTTTKLKVTIQQLRADDNMRAWHSNGNNHLFADGHVKWMPLDVIYDASYWKP